MLESNIEEEKKPEPVTTVGTAAGDAEVARPHVDMEGRAVNQMLKKKQDPMNKDPSRTKQDLSQVDKLYIISVIASAFASALSFGAVGYVTASPNQTVQAFDAFILIYLFFSHIQTIVLIVGLNQNPNGRMNHYNVAGMAMNAMNLAIVIVTLSLLGTIQNGFTNYDARQFGPSCLVIAIFFLALSLACQAAAQVINSFGEPEKAAIYVPFHPPNSRVGDHFIANAILCSVNLSFSIGALLYATYIGANNVIQAFVSLYFIFAVVACVFSIIALTPVIYFPSISLIISWVFSLFCFIFAVIAFATLIAWGITPFEFTCTTIGLVISLLAMGTGMAAHQKHLGRDSSTCCSCTGSDIYSDIERARANLEIERAKREATRLRNQREKLQGP